MSAWAHLCSVRLLHRMLESYLLTFTLAERDWCIKRHDLHDISHLDTVDIGYQNKDRLSGHSRPCSDAMKTPSQSSRTFTKATLRYPLPIVLCQKIGRLGNSSISAVLQQICVNVL